MFNNLNNFNTDVTMLKLKNEQYQNNLSKIKDSELREQTDQFEALIVKTLLDVSMEDSNELFGDEAGNKIYQSMYRDELSKLSVGSFGISNTLFNFLKREQDNSPVAETVTNKTDDEENSDQKELERTFFPTSPFNKQNQQTPTDISNNINNIDKIEVEQEQQPKIKPAKIKSALQSYLYDGIELEIIDKK